MTWHPELEQLLFSPVEEQAELRGAVVGSHAGATLPPNSTAAITTDSTNQTEIVVTFALPKAGASGTFGVALLAPGDVAGSSWFYVRFDAASMSAEVGQGEVPVYAVGAVATAAAAAAAVAAAPDPAADAPLSMTCASVKNGTCLTRAFPILNQYRNTVDVAVCCANCQADTSCVAWNVNRKTRICYTRGSYVPSSGSQCAAGQLRPGPPAPPPPAPSPPHNRFPPPGKLQLLPTDTNITIRLFVDSTFTEVVRTLRHIFVDSDRPRTPRSLLKKTPNPFTYCTSPAHSTWRTHTHVLPTGLLGLQYWQDGRVAMTAITTTQGAAHHACKASVYAGSAGATLLSATAWAVESIWTTPEDVLAAPRRPIA